MLSKKESQSFKLKLKLPALLRSPFSRLGKKKASVVGEDAPRTSSSSYQVTISTPPDDAPSQVVTSKAGIDMVSTPQSATFFDVNENQQGLTTSVSREANSVDGRCQSPAPSQARSQRQSMSKTTSGENFRVSMTVDNIKQQLNDGLQMLAEFKKSLRPSSDVQQYDEAIGNFEGAANGLATLKNKLSNRKLGSGNPNRNSYVLPPPDLKVEFEDSPFSMGMPGIEDPSKETTTLGVVQENKENEAQEEEKEKQQQQQYLGLNL